MQSVVTENHLSMKDASRLMTDANVKKIRRDNSLTRSNDGTFYMGDIYMVAEEEASIINFYLNSLKHKRDLQKGKQGISGSKGGAGVKTMKELIAETLKENEDRKEQLKKLLDWKSLDVTVDKK